MTERRQKGAGLGAQDRGAMQWRLERLHRRTEEGVRELGARILEMYQQGALDTDVVRKGAARLDELERRAAELEAAIRGETRWRPDPPRRERPGRRAVPPTPAIRPVLGAEGRPASGQSGSTATEPPTGGERDERMEQAVEAARRQGEEHGTAEILALEEDLERERKRAAKSLEEVQRRLEEAEARAADSVTVTDARTRKEAADPLRDQRSDVRRELEAELEWLERPQIEALEAETAARIEEAVEEERREAEELRAETRAKEEVDAARRAAELRFDSELKIREQSLRAEHEAASEAAEAAHGRLDQIAEQIVAAARRVEEAESQLARERERLQREAEERLDAEVRRLDAKTEGSIEDRLAKAITETEARMDAEAERRLRELEAELERRMRAREQELIEEAENRAKRAEAKVEKAEQASIDFEVDARTAAAEWLRGQARALTRDAERDAERAFAERERELAAELEEAARALRSAQHQLREAEERAESAEHKLGETSTEPEREAETADQPGPEASTDERPAVERPKRAAAAKAQRRRGGPLDVNTATFEELRKVGMSVTQATRVIAYRERCDGFKSVDDLDSVPGITEGLLGELKDRLTA